LRDGQWLREPRAAALVETERTRPLTPAEAQAQAFLDGFDTLAILIRAPGRNATTEEIANIDQLQTESRLVAGPDLSPVAPTFNAASYWAQTAAEGTKLIGANSAKLGIDNSAELTPNSCWRQKTYRPELLKSTLFL
jgi:hypothetical protein